MLTVELSEHPQLRAMLKTLGYRRHTARIVFASRCELNGRYWDGGSRDVYTVCDIVPQRFTRIPQCAPPQFGGPTIPQFHGILPGQCVISHGIFCGKPAHATVYLGLTEAMLLGVNQQAEHKCVRCGQTGHGPCGCGFQGETNAQAFPIIVAS